MTIDTMEMKGKNRLAEICGLGIPSLEFIDNYEQRGLLSALHRP